MRSYRNTWTARIDPIAATQVIKPYTEFYRISSDPIPLTKSDGFSGNGLTVGSDGKKAIFLIVSD